MLARFGYTGKQIEAVLRSKVMRWTGDRTGRYGRITSGDLRRYLEGCYGPINGDRCRQEVIDLERGTFGRVEAETPTPDPVPAMLDAFALIDSIVAALSGKEWSPDTLDEIANILQAAGYKIEEPA
jgi:hypothetical protein